MSLQRFTLKLFTQALVLPAYHIRLITWGITASKQIALENTLCPPMTFAKGLLVKDIEAVSQMTF